MGVKILNNVKSIFLKLNLYLNLAWFPLDFNMCGENALIIYSSTCSLHVNQNSKYNNGKCIQYKNFIYRSWYINIFSMNIVMYRLIFSWRYTVLVFILFWNVHINVERTNWLYIIVHCTIHITPFSIFWHLKNGIQNCVFGNITKRITH